MNYNKKEQRAIDALYRIASNLKDGKLTGLESGDLKAIKNVLGIDFHETTKTQTDVDKKYDLVRGKEDLMLYFGFYNQGWCSRHCYFPFQLKPKQKK